MNFIWCYVPLTLKLKIMKPYILLAFILIGTLSFAQPSKRGRETPPPPPMSKMKEMSAENSATLMSKKMTLQLDLSEVQQTKVYELILESTIKKKAQRVDRPKGKPSKEQQFEQQNKMLDDKIAFSAVVGALDDEAYEIRILALQKIDLINKFSKKNAIKKIMEIANTDVKTLVQAEAINTLGKLTDPELKSIFEKGLQMTCYCHQKQIFSLRMTRANRVEANLVCSTIAIHQSFLTAPMELFSWETLP